MHTCGLNIRHFLKHIENLEGVSALVSSLFFSPISAVSAICFRRRGLIQAEKKGIDNLGLEDFATRLAFEGEFYS